LILGLTKIVLFTPRQLCTILDNAASAETC